MLLLLISKDRTLEHHLRILAADSESDVVTASGEFVHLQLHVWLCRGIESTVIGEEEVSDNRLLHFSDGLQSPGVVQFFVSPAYDADVGVTVSECKHQHGREHQAEPWRCQNAALINSVGDWEGVKRVAVVEDMGHHACVELEDNGGTEHGPKFFPAMQRSEIL